MKTIKLLSFLFFFLTISSAYGQDGFTSLPYFCGFEEPEDTVGTYGWKFISRSAKHSFVVGDAVSNLGKNSMYVSVDGGATASYSWGKETQGSVVIAYKAFYLLKGEYDLMFDYKMQGGHLESGDVTINSDIMRVAFYNVLDLSGKPSAVATGVFPNYALQNSFKDKDGVEIFNSSVWKQVEGKIKADNDGYYYLVFLFKEDGNEYVYNPGACIDNIQLDRVKSLSACAAKPTNIQVDKEILGIKLTWSGNADSYDLKYDCVSSKGDRNATVIEGISSEEYSLLYADLEEGIYNFRVRAKCENDSSSWVEKTNVIVYDESKHCLNYMDFYASGTSCYYGNFNNPAAVERVYDFGYESRNSIHTVHYMNDEYDRLTGYKLKTVPEGQIASVRLGNWTEGGNSDSPIGGGGSVSGQITYTYTIPHDKSVLLLHYAAVLQYAAHHPANMQTRIQVEILDEKGVKLECASADFNARDVAEANTRGWKTYQPKEGEVIEFGCPIKWLDWSVLGMNLANYAGRTVKIRLTLNACESDYHFAYGYFVLDCTEGEIEGMSCTEKADTLFVPSGFDYLWYVQGDANKTPVSTEQFFVVPENDINSYSVDLIYPEDNGCYFTLNANVWPRIPQVEMDYVAKPQNCVNYVEFINNSKMIDLKMDKEGNVIDTLDVAPSVASIKDYYFEIRSNKNTVFENGMTASSDPSMRIIVPNEGDTFVVVVKGMFNACEDIKEYELSVPELQPSFAETVRYVCNGSEVEFNGKTYTEPGVYIDTLQSIYGCDSILQLTLETLVADTVVIDTMLCSAELPFVWNVYTESDTLMQSGVYEKRIVSSLGCDSLYYVLNLDVLESLVLNFDIPTICADDDIVEIDYTVSSGKLTGYSVAYSDKAKNAGFEDIEVLDSVGDIESIKFILPQNVRPNSYEVDFTFYNSDCGNVDTTLVFDVLYPDSVVAQRWNDVLVVKNSNYNGGYEFVAYQWFLNGVPLEGFTTSQYYTGSNLDFNGDYQVLLTRKDDGVSVLTCSFVPTEFSKEELENTGVVVFASDVINVETPKAAKCYVYSMSGLLYSVSDLEEGVNIIDMPKEAGVYIMQFNYLDGDVEIRKIVVGKI